MNTNVVKVENPRAGKENRILKAVKKHRYLYLLLVPVIVYYIIFVYLPMYGVTIAFKDFYYTKGIWGSPWNGFKNFEILFGGSSFYKVLRNTMLISTYKFIAGFPGPIILALLLNELRSLLFKKTIQTISYLPHFLSWVVLGGIFIEFLSPSRGIINHLLQMVGIEPVFFLGDPRYFRSALVVTSVWKGIGWSSIIYLASLSSIDPELYSAAAIDGAKRFRQIIHISLPALQPVIIITLILSCDFLIGDDFDQVFNLMNTAVSEVGETLSIYTYKKGLLEMNYSFATAVGLFRNVVAFLLVLLSNTIARKFSDYAIW